MSPPCPTRITIGGVTFDRVVYDWEGDVLYLHVGDPAMAVDFDESPEGHALRYDAAGRLVGLIIVHARYLLERDGRITVTLPPPQLEAGVQELAAALGLPASIPSTTASPAAAASTRRPWRWRTASWSSPTACCATTDLPGPGRHVPRRARCRPH